MCICVLTLLLLLVVFLLPLRLKVASSYHQNTCFWKSSIQSAISNPGYFIIVSIVEVNHMNQSLRKVHGWPEKANSQLRQSTFLEKSMIEKRSVFFLVPKKGNAKECSNYPIIALISHASKVMLKILRVRLRKYMNRELEVFILGLEKAEVPEIKLPTSAVSWKKQESSSKTSISALLPMPKPLTVWITINCGKFRKRWEYQTTWPASWETCMQVRKQQLELDME